MSKFLDGAVDKTLPLIVVGLVAIGVLLITAFNMLPLASLDTTYSALFFLAVAGLLFAEYILGFVVLVFVGLPVVFRIWQRKTSQET